MAEEFYDAIKIRWKTWDGNKIMNEKKYKVIDKFGHILADSMSLDIALILIKGYASEYYNEPLSIRIEENVVRRGIYEGGICEPSK